MVRNINNVTYPEHTMYQTMTGVHIFPVDRGSNGGVVRYDGRCISTCYKIINIMEIDNHQLTFISNVTAGGVSQ